MDESTGMAETEELALPRLTGYEVLHLLGRGGSGSVWAVRRDDGVRLAAKVVDGGIAELDHEVELLRAVEHPHLLRIVDVLETQDEEGARAVLVTELAEGGSLAQSIRARERFTPGELVTVLCPVARAMHDLHGLGLVHADLSPGNVLLTAEGKPLIADLGVSRIAGVEGDEVWATELWAAPEVLAGSTPEPASDVYSLGAIAWAALTGSPPEPAALRPDLGDLAPELSDALRDLVTSCLSHTPSARPTAGELALRLWDCADPEPAPVQGSPGGRLAGAQDVGDPAVELTRRIRAEARAETRWSGARHAASEPEPPWWRSAVVRRVSVLGAVLGAVCGVAVVAGPPALAWARTAHHGRHTAESPAPPHSAPSPSHDTPASTEATVGLQRPAKVVQSLLTARARAWNADDRKVLALAMVKDSPAWERDRESLRTLADRGARYRHLDFTVGAASVRRFEGDTARVRVTVDRSSYEVVTAKGTHRVAPDRGERIDLQLRRVPAGWRIVDWSEVT